MFICDFTGKHFTKGYGFVFQDKATRNEANDSKPLKLGALEYHFVIDENTVSLDLPEREFEKTLHGFLYFYKTILVSQEAFDLIATLSEEKMIKKFSLLKELDILDFNYSKPIEHYLDSTDQAIFLPLPKEMLGKLEGFYLEKEEKTLQVAHLFSHSYGELWRENRAQFYQQFIHNAILFGKDNTHLSMKEIIHHLDDYKLYFFYKGFMDFELGKYEELNGFKKYYYHPTTNEHRKDLRKAFDELKNK